METKELVRNLLGSDAFWQVNKRIAQEIGLFEAILIADLIAKDKYFDDRNQLDEDGYFFNTRDNIKKDTCISKHQQRNAIKKLEENGYIDSKKVGMPSKAYYRINYSQLFNILTYSRSKIEPLVVEKLHTNKNKEIKIKNNIQTSGKPEFVEEEKPFIFEEYIEIMKKDNNKAIKLIAIFFLEKKLRFSSHAEVKLAIKRHIREANIISKIYKLKDIEEAIAWCKKEHANIWTMETITKYFTTHRGNK